MDTTILIPMLLASENRFVEAIKSALYAQPAFRGIDTNWQAFIIQVIAGGIGVILALVFGFNLLISTPLPALLGEVISGVGLSFGSAGIQFVFNLLSAWTATKQAQAADIRVLTGTQTALIQGESLKPYTPLADFTDTQLRAVAYKLGTLPPGDISHEELVSRIINATAPKLAV